MRRTLAKSASLAVACWLWPLTAGAAPELELSGEYAFLSPFRSRDDRGASGWRASVGARVTPGLDIVGEAGGHYRRETIRGACETFGCDPILQAEHAFLIGARASSRNAGRLAPFAQILTGWGRLSGVGFKAIQPGAGVDFRGDGRVSMRLGADYRFIFDDRSVFGDAGHPNQLRLHLGVVLCLGGR